MAFDAKVTAALEPAFLLREAKPFLREPTATAADERTPLEKSIRRAHQLLANDLAQIERLKRDGADIAYADCFGAQYHEKIAALIFLTRSKLLDIAGDTSSILDIVDARRDTSLLVEILFRLSAVEGLGILYDFAAVHAQGDNAPFWQKVGQHYLHLLTLLTLTRTHVLYFLRARPAARRQVEQGMASMDEAVARAYRALGEDYVHAKAQLQTEPPPAPAEYTIFYQRYEQSLPDAQTTRLSALLTAQDRIHRLVDAKDLPGLVKWFVEGSLPAVQYLLHSARTNLSASALLDLLTAVLALNDGDPIRLAAAVLELGRLNRAVHAAGGDPNINTQLIEATMTDKGARTGVAQLAVRELGGVNAFNEILSVLERAPIVEVADEGIRVLRDLRRLPMAEAIVNRRATLQTAFKAAQRHLQEIQSLMDSVWACQNEYMATPYITRLRELQAIHEIEIIGQKHQHIATLAKRILSEMQLEMTGGRGDAMTR